MTPIITPYFTAGLLHVFLVFPVSTMLLFAGSSPDLAVEAVVSEEVDPVDEVEDDSVDEVEVDPVDEVEDDPVVVALVATAAIPVLVLEEVTLLEVDDPEVEVEETAAELDVLEAGPKWN
jgi:hypothetical protein